MFAVRKSRTSAVNLVLATVNRKKMAKNQKPPCLEKSLTTKPKNLYNSIN